MLVAARSPAEGLTPDRLGIIYNSRDPVSTRIAKYYADRRHVPAVNLVGLDVPEVAVIGRDELSRLRGRMLDRLPDSVQSIVLVWSQPYAVECMSVTTAFAAGYHADFCEPGCARTALSPLYDTAGWLPADTIGWLPAMLLPTSDEALARSLIERGIQADGTRPRGTIYLVSTQDASRNVRAPFFGDVATMAAGLAAVQQLVTPVNRVDEPAIAYFTGVVRVDELARIHFLPGAIADHLTSLGGILGPSGQMSALEWLRQGATASYGTVSEPCNHTAKFPSPTVLVSHYVHGETALESYWKSVAMPGQGLFIGEPLSRPYGGGP